MTDDRGDAPAILFLCLGNICRSPLAEGAARLMLMLDLVPGRAGESVTDPYYGADDGFAETWADVSAVAAALVAATGPSSG